MKLRAMTNSKTHPPQYWAILTSVFLTLLFVLGYCVFETLIEINSWEEHIPKLGVSVGLIIVLGLASRSQKAKISHGRIKNPLPGSRSAALAKEDDRINFERLQSKVGRFPRNPKEQNAFWYSIYSPIKTNDAVMTKNRRYILVRDITYLLALATLLALFILFVLATKLTLFGFIAILATYLACVLATNNYGNDLVLMVLAIAQS